MSVSNWIALLALGVSIFSLYRTTIQQRKNLTITINECFLFRNVGKFDVFFSFNNLSSLPISINKIEIFHNDNILFEDHGITELLYSSKGNRGVSSLLYNNELPINLSPYTSMKDIIRFDLLGVEVAKDYGKIEELVKSSEGELQIKVYTTRGESKTTIKIADVEIKEEAFEFYRKYANHNKVSNQNLI